MVGAARGIGQYSDISIGACEAGVAIMKVQLMLSIEHTLKERLINIKKQTSIPMSKIVSDLLEAHLSEIEEQHSIQQSLPLSRDN